MSENALKPMPVFIPESLLMMNHHGSHYAEKVRELQDYIRAMQSHPTPSSALTKALELIRASENSILFLCRKCGWQGHEQSVSYRQSGEFGESADVFCPECHKKTYMADLDGEEVEVSPENEPDEVDPWEIAFKALEALRASPGGEGEIERINEILEIVRREAEKNALERDFAIAGLEESVERAEIRGAEWALEKAKDSCYISVDTDNFEPQRSISGWPSAAAIVASHRSKP